MPVRIEISCTESSIAEITCFLPTPLIKHDLRIAQGVIVYQNVGGVAMAFCNLYNLFNSDDSGYIENIP